MIRMVSLMRLELTDSLFPQDLARASIHTDQIEFELRGRSRTSWVSAAPAAARAASAAPAFPFAPGLGEFGPWWGRWRHSVGGLDAGVDSRLEEHLVPPDNGCGIRPIPRQLDLPFDVLSFAPGGRWIAIWRDPHGVGAAPGGPMVLCGYRADGCAEQQYQDDVKHL